MNCWIALLLILAQDYPGNISNVNIYDIDTDEIPRFFLLLKPHIFIARSEDTIFIVFISPL